MASTTLIGLFAVFRNLKERKIDIWTLLIVGFCAAFYEVSVIKWSAEFFR
jgi:hypothetical protein